MKSSPELWAECSDAASLARHLGQFGEIRITKLEPETAVAWEGSAASGTVTLEPSGWGTRVILTVTEEAGGEPVPAPVAVEPEPEPEPAPDPEPASDPEPAPEPELDLAPAVPAAALADAAARPGGLGRLFARFRRRPAARPVDLVQPAVEPEVEPAVEPEREPAVEPEVEPEVNLEPAREPEPVAEARPASVTVPDESAEQALTAALDSLGQAHHRPYSRS